jgi:crotonobetainyl-CoA:carnitine CoA-transferase CaiB-like acyl-CoA transferase
METNDMPLEGIRVIDLSTYAAAPVCCRALAEFGADVIKVESCLGDVYRYFGLLLKSPVQEDENPIFEVDNAFKRGICLDLKKPEGQEIIHRLLAVSDVFVTNLRNGSLQNLRLTYEELAPRYPKLVYGYINGYGNKGKNADKPGFDLTAYWARGGVMGQMGEPDAPPPTAWAGFGDHPTGLFLAGGILAALLGRTQTGRGEKVEVALYHAAIWNMGLNITACQYQEAGIPKFSRKDPVNPLANPYKCRDDKWLCLAIIEHDRYWPIFCKTIGREDLIDDKRFNSVVAAQDNSAQLVSILDDAIAKRDRDEWVKIWGEADITFEIIQSFSDILADEQAHSNNFIMEVDYKNGNQGFLPTMTIQLKRSGKPGFKHAPLHGEHTKQVLAELGYKTDEIDAFIRKNIVRAS